MIRDAALFEINHDVFLVRIKFEFGFFERRRSKFSARVVGKTERLDGHPDCIAIQLAVAAFVVKQRGRIFAIGQVFDRYRHAIFFRGHLRGTDGGFHPHVSFVVDRDQHAALVTAEAFYVDG